MYVSSIYPLPKTKPKFPFRYIVAIRYSILGKIIVNYCTMNIFSTFQRDWPYDKEYLDFERMNPKMNEREIMDCIVNDKVNP